MIAKSPRGRLRADLALVAVALIWGSTFVMVKRALDDVSTILFLALRFSIAAAALWFTFRGRGTHYPRNRAAELRGGAAVGAFLFAGYLLQTAGLKSTTAAKAGFITGFYIVLVPLLGAAIYRKMPHSSEVIGVVMATVGMSMMTLQSAKLDIGRGDLLVLGCAVAFACHILALGHYSRSMSYEALSLYQVGACALLAGGSFWWMETPRLVWSWAVIVTLAVTSLLATALSFSVQSWAQQFTTPTRTALIFSLEPVFAWITSFLLAGEVLSLRAAAGAVLILSGILLVEMKPIRFLSHPSS
jgi:drug/metabolite transporter (DMT)-like permease